MGISLHLLMLTLLVLTQTSMVTCLTNYFSTSILYVTPTINGSCPGIPCLTLSQYADDQHTYFYENTELHFLPGVHSLTKQIVIEGGTNVTLFALIGSQVNESKIVSSEEAAFHLTGIESTQIDSLHFSGSNNLVIRNTTTLLTSNVSFLTSINGSGFTFENIQNITATDTTIMNSSTISSAGTIRWSNGVFVNANVIKNNVGDSVLVIEQSSIVFKTISFIQNHAKKSSSLKIVASTVIFDGYTLFNLNNCEQYGGAMSIINSTVSSTSQIELTSNNAKNGGAIQLDHSVLILRGSIDVFNNSATLPAFGYKFGGAILSNGSNITMDGRVNFCNNHVVDVFSLTFSGAIHLLKSTLTMTGSIDFSNNYAKSYLSFGGAILLSNSTLIATCANLTFTNNSASSGGAIAISRILDVGLPHLLNTLMIEGDSLFDSNVAITSAGALYGDGALDLQFTGSTTFTRNRGDQLASQILIVQTSKASLKFSGLTEIKNSYSRGATVALQNSVKVIFSGINRFINNSGSKGVLQAYSDVSFVFEGESFFLNNRGGTLALTSSSNPSLISGVAYFIDNDSGIYLRSSEIKLEGDFRFIRNKDGIGCINIIDNSNMTINGSVTMHENSAVLGAAIASFQSTMHLIGDHYSFSQNTATDDGGSLFAQGSSIYIHAENTTFTSNIAQRGGAIHAINSNIFFSGHQNFESNKAFTGGAIALGLYSVIHFNDLEITFINNSAKRGAIFHVDDILSSVQCIDNSKLSVVGPLSIRSQCFYSSPKNSTVKHSRNIASDVGDILYGGHLTRCNREKVDEMFKMLFNVDYDMYQIENITSDPYQLAFCKAGRIIYPISSTILSVDTIPGRMFSVSVAGLDQLYQPVSSFIRAEIPSEFNFTARLATFESKQNTSNNCTELNYHLFTPASSLNLTLYAEGPCNTLGTASRTVLIKLGSCPDGFQLSDDECICADQLLQYTSGCNVDDESIENNGDFWAAGKYENGSYKGIISFPHCPFDYCKKDNVKFKLNDPDSQCANDRSGIICGQCKLNYSLTFGDGRCLICSNNRPSTFGLLLLFAFLGIFLVLLLMLLKITVVTGTLNGLIFYANIVDASRDIFIPQVGWLRTFISWLNLDFGFNVCFYEGMDFYAYTWMQFLFPLYIWMLVIIIIVISRYSVWVTKKVGSNPVAVLATLILLSYTKLLRTIITIFYFAIIQLPNNQTSTAWLYDGNVEFLRGKHLAIFVFALLFFTFLFFPYNLLLMFGPWLQKLSGERINDSKAKALLRKALLGWLEDFRLKMLLDAYTIPYNEGHRYWTGVFLMLRCVLLLVFASNTFRNSNIASLAITSVMLGVAFLCRAFSGRIYKNQYIDILEATFLLNLGILSTATLYTTQVGGNQQALANASVGISFVLFLGIIAYHAYMQAMATNVCIASFRKLKTIVSKITRSDKERSPLPLTDTPEDLAPLTTYISV